MFIKKITNRLRRDLRVIYECEHCGHIEEGYGYDDNYFHQAVIPNKVCSKCNKKANGSHPPMQPKYNDGVII